MSRVPSLQTLQLLRVAAQRRSLSLAGEKLGITQSAASRRIAALEADIGMPLLVRRRRGVEVTDQGAIYLKKVGPAIDAILAATDAAKSQAGSGPLRLRVYATFAARWLLPRLPDFQAQFPKIEVNIDTTVVPVSFPQDNADLAIQFGSGDWPNTSSQLLFNDVIQPVCTPQFARTHSDAIASGRLEELLLIDSHYRRADWHDWAESAGLSLEGARFMQFPGSLLAYHAAIEGVGLAMAQSRLITDELNSGKLVAPFEHVLCRKLGYYVVAPIDADPPRARAFRRWLIRKIGEM